MGLCLGCTNIDIKFRIAKQNLRSVAKYVTLQQHFNTFTCIGRQISLISHTFFYVESS